MKKPIIFRHWAIYLDISDKISPITYISNSLAFYYFGPGIVTKYKISHANNNTQTP